MGPSDCSVSISHGISSLKCSSSPPMPRTREASAAAAVARTSGMGSTSAFCSSGSSSGTYGDMSLESATSAHMFPAILAAFFLRSALRSRRPRVSTGTMSARDGASTVFTKVVSSRMSRHGRVLSAGRAMAPRRYTDSAWISGLRMTSPMALRAKVAASTTLGWVSMSVSLRRGTIWGRQAPSCLGAHADMAPRSCTEPCLVRQALSSRPFMSAGSTSLTPCADSCPITALAALAVASRTLTDRSPKHTSNMGSTWMT
mmetsp:Transcript_12687/g.30626  ORF Transcript_12687/g.30626 Transcript_12687/m.30626 type:complete len:258 (+) Transcript_12687:2-775(+)